MPQLGSHCTTLEPVNARAVSGWAREVTRAVERLLDARGISDRQIATMIGRSQNYVSIRLRGEAPLSISDIEDIADALGINAGSFLAGVSEGGSSVADDNVFQIRGEERRRVEKQAAKRGRRKVDEPAAE